MIQCTKTESAKPWKRIAVYTAIDMTAGKFKHAEERRVKWTTHYNLELWFDDWEKVLGELGFFKEDGTSSDHMSPEQYYTQLQ